MVICLVLYYYHLLHGMCSNDSSRTVVNNIAKTNKKERTYLLTYSRAGAHGLSSTKLSGATKLSLCDLRRVYYYTTVYTLKSLLWLAVYVINRMY